MAWTRFFRRRRWHEERARELEVYLQIETDENIARGMAPGAARTAALRKFGNRSAVREEIYRMNTLTFLDTLAGDLHSTYATIQWINLPGKAVVGRVATGDIVVIIVLLHPAGQSAAVGARAREWRVPSVCFGVCVVASRRNRGLMGFK